MDMLWEIVFQTVEILTLVFGFSGIALSVLLLFSPGLTLSLGKIFNRYFDVEKNLVHLDKYIQTDKFAYRHNVLAGLSLIIGSIIVLFFLFFRLDTGNFAGIFINPGKYSALIDILLNFMAILGKIVGFLSLVIGLFLLFAASQLKTLEEKMNTWFATQPIVDKLGSSNHDIDTIVYKQHIIFGLIGLSASTLLTILAFINIFG